jgi:hypothetical protein
VYPRKALKRIAAKEHKKKEFKEFKELQEFKESG